MDVTFLGAEPRMNRGLSWWRYSGDVGYCNCLNAPQVGVGRVSAAG
jgi:hypothetical protein